MPLRQHFASEIYSSHKASLNASWKLFYAIKIVHLLWLLIPIYYIYDSDMSFNSLYTLYSLRREGRQHREFSKSVKVLQYVALQLLLI